MNENLLNTSLMNSQYVVKKTKKTLNKLADIVSHYFEIKELYKNFKKNPDLTNLVYILWSIDNNDKTPNEIRETLEKQIINSIDINIINKLHTNLLDFMANNTKINFLKILIGINYITNQSFKLKHFKDTMDNMFTTYQEKPSKVKIESLEDNLKTLLDCTKYIQNNSMSYSEINERLHMIISNINENISIIKDIK